MILDTVVAIVSVNWSTRIDVVAVVSMGRMICDEEEEASMYMYIYVQQTTA